MSGSEERYSFDDYHIGVSGGSTLKTREITRPEGLTNKAWYEFAGQVIGKLNSFLMPECDSRDEDECPSCGSVGFSKTVRCDFCEGRV